MSLGRRWNLVPDNEVEWFIESTLVVNGYFLLHLSLALQKMFHKTEELFPKKMESDVDDMDTSDTQWGWFYLAECGKWHMFQVPHPKLHRQGLATV